MTHDGDKTAQFLQSMAQGAVWKDATILMVDALVSEAVVRSWLPPGVTPMLPCRATFAIADYPHPGAYGAPYKEAAVLLHIEDEKGPLVFCPWMVVNEDTALILGRELLGYPKKMATIEIKYEGSRISGSVIRKGIEVMKIIADIVSVESPVAPFGIRVLNAFGNVVSGMSLMEGGALPSTIHQASTVAAQLVLRHSETDPLSVLEPTAPFTGRLLNLDFGGTKEHAKVIGPIAASWVLENFKLRAF